VLMLSGDDPTAGDQPDAKPVFDFGSADLIQIARQMTDKGSFPSKGSKGPGDDAEPDTKEIISPPQFFIGAADVPVTEANEKWSDGLATKIAAGAQFVQTQLCYDMDIIRGYADLLGEKGHTDKLYFLIGNGPLASSKSAIWMRDNLWGVVVPDAIIERLDGADDAKAEGIKICVEQMEEMSNIEGVAGVHLMAPINTASIPGVIAAAGLANRT